MKLLRNSKIPILLLFLAVISFATLSLGGNYYHELVHNHAEGHEEECPVYKMLSQAVLTFSIVLAALIFKFVYQILDQYQAAFPKACYLLPSLRAPPIA